MRLVAENPPERFPGGKDLQQRARGVVRFRSRGGIDPQQDAISLGRPPEARAPGRSEGGAVSQIEDEVRGGHQGDLFEAKARVVGGDLRNLPGHAQPAEARGGQIGGAKRRVPVQEEAGPENPALAGTGDGSEQDLPGVAAKGVAPGGAQRRISSTGSTLTPLSRR